MAGGGCIASRRSGLPAHVPGVSGLVSRRGQLYRVPGAAALAGGLHLPAVRGAVAAGGSRGSVWMCARCGRKTSVTAGTIFHRTHSPLSSWFAAAWFVTSQKNGVSALGLQKAHGVRLV